MRIKIFFCFPALVLMLCFAMSANGQVPQLINYQGQLNDEGGNPRNGTFDFEFRIYDAQGSLLWSEKQNNIRTDPTFNVLLGSVNPIDSDLFDNGTASFLEVRVDGDILSPRQQFASVPYAFTSGSGGGVSGGSAGVSRGTVVDQVVTIQGTTSMKEVVRTVLDAPADGFVIVTATGQGRFRPTGSTSPANSMNYQIREASEPRVGRQNPGFHSLGFTDGSAPDAKTFLIASMQRVFTVKRNTRYTFIFEAVERDAGGEQGFWNPQITALFVPQQYGNIQ